VRHTWTPCDAVRPRVEREVKVGRVDLLGFVYRVASGRAYVSFGFESPIAVGAKWVHEAGEEVRKGYAATWASWREEVGIRRVDGRWRSGRKGAEDVGVFGGVSCHQH